MGKIFLVLIVVGLIYGGYGIYSNVTALQDPAALRSRYKPDGEGPEITEGQDSGEEIKVAQTPISSEKIQPIEEKEPLPVVASSSEFILVEGWDIVRAGEELPDGTTLVAWTSSSATVLSPEGVELEVRFRRWGEAMAQAAKTVAASVVSEPVTVSPWAKDENP